MDAQKEIYLHVRNTLRLEIKRQGSYSFQMHGFNHLFGLSVAIDVVVWM